MNSLFVLLSLGTIGAVSALQSFITIPTYAEVNPGNRVVMRCEVENKGGECRWEKDGTPVGIFPGKYEWARPEDMETGNCSLVILDSSAEYDDGVWQCQVTASNFKHGDSLISDGAELVVRSPPTDLYLVSKQGKVEANEAVTGTSGSLMDIKCVARGSNPVPRLRFSINGVPVTSDSEQINQRLETGGWLSSLQLSTIPDRSQDGSSISCTAHHQALASPMEASSSLSIHYPPTVKEVKANQTEVDEGDSVSFHCLVESNPVASISWKRQSVPGVVIGHGEYFVISDIDQTGNDVYICEAENEVGIGEGQSDPIKTNHAPIIRNIGPSSNILMVRGKRLELSCLADASPAPKYQWSQIKLSGEVVTRTEAVGHTLVIDNVGYEEAGDYFCHASNVVGGDLKEAISEGITVEVRGAPVVDLDEELREVEVFEGDSLEIKIRFCSNPTPILSWRYGRRILDESFREGLEFSIDTKVGPHCAVSKLTLEDILEEEAGDYVLTVENDHGRTEQRIIVHVTKNVFTREIIIAIVAGTLLTLIMIIFITVTRCKTRNIDKNTVKDVESCGTSTTSDNNKNEKLETDEDEIVFNESYEKFAPDIIPHDLHRPSPYKPSYTDLCNYPLSSNGGSMRVGQGANVDKMINMYNSNILDHINTINYTQYNNQDNIYYWRQNFDNKIYS